MIEELFDAAFKAGWACTIIHVAGVTTIHIHRLTGGTFFTGTGSLSGAVGQARQFIRNNNAREYEKSRRPFAECIVASDDPPELSTKPGG